MENVNITYRLGGGWRMSNIYLETQWTEDRLSTESAPTFAPLSFWKSFV